MTHIRKTRKTPCAGWRVNQRLAHVPGILPDKPSFNWTIAKYGWVRYDVYMGTSVGIIA